jgi:adenosine deaminase
LGHPAAAAVNRDILNKLPKAELHVHLGGFISAEELCKLMQRYEPRDHFNSLSPKMQNVIKRSGRITAFLKHGNFYPQAVRELYSFRGIQEFLSLYVFAVSFFKTCSDLQELIGAARDYFRQENIIYSEVTVAPALYLAQGIGIADLFQLLAEESRQPGCRIGWVVDLVRNLGPLECRRMLERVLEAHLGCVCGITLGGNEQSFPAADFESVFEDAKGNGFGTSIHVGETGPAESVRQALHALRPDRIGHGIGAAADADLMRELAACGTALELCPTSNVATGCLDSVSRLPIKKFLQHGIPCTINSDDPAFFKTSLTEELLMTQAQCALSDEQLLAVLENGFRHAFLPEAEKEHYLQQLLME